VSPANTASLRPARTDSCARLRVVCTMAGDAHAGEQEGEREAQDSA
jgi:hypothetical protein